jgi:hypothetical protein
VEQDSKKAGGCAAAVPDSWALLIWSAHRQLLLLLPQLLRRVADARPQAGSALAKQC